MALTLTRMCDTGGKTVYPATGHFADALKQKQYSSPAGLSRDISMSGARGAGKKAEVWPVADTLLSRGSRNGGGCKGCII